MDTRRELYSDNLMKAVGNISLITPTSITRALSLYIKIFNDEGVVNTVSLAYVDNYDGKSKYRQFKRYYDQLSEMFIRNNIDSNDRHRILINSARRIPHIPTCVKDMKRIVQIVIEETHRWIQFVKSKDVRDKLIGKFKLAIKKYLTLTYELGYNEPSLCVKNLAETHKLDKYIMSGEFSVMLLPFLPDIEDTIRKSYETYDMTDAWELIKGRYFNHKCDYMTLATEIKKFFTQNIRNFSDYIDNLYTEKFHGIMLGKKPKQS